MEEIGISKFKAKCLAVLERVRQSRNPVLITKFGEPLARIVPPSTRPKSGQWIGSLAHTGRIHGDIISPPGREDDWEALQS